MCKHLSFFDWGDNNSSVGVCGYGGGVCVSVCVSVSLMDGV